MRLSTRRLLLTDEDRRFEITVPALADAGGWPGVFTGEGGNRPLTLEIGLGKDTHLLEKATARPERPFVGIECSRKKLDKVLSKVARQANGDDLTNLRVLHADATRVLEAIFPPGSLGEVFVLFPDPWPKKRHRGRRILNREFLAQIAARMAPGGRLEVRTDNVEYLEQIVEVLGAEPNLRNLVAPHPYLLEPLEPDDHIPTLFEQKFIERGLPIHYFYLERRD
jgi:tRNA (guanine-N7-)-methyltransferase